MLPTDLAEWVTLPNVKRLGEEVGRVVDTPRLQLAGSLSQEGFELLHISPHLVCQAISAV